MDFEKVHDFLREDWRTCRKLEADCISYANEWASDVLNDKVLDWYYPGVQKEFPLMLSQNTLEACLAWTLFGRWYLIQLTRDNEYWYHTTRYCRTRGSSEYRQWYREEFRWFQGGWRESH